LYVIYFWVMALDLSGERRVKVNGLETSETLKISPPNKNPWNEDDNLSTLNLGIQSRLVDLDDIDKNESGPQSQYDSPSTTVEGNEPAPTDTTYTVTSRAISTKSTSLPTGENSSSKLSVGESKVSDVVRPSIRKSVSIAINTPVKKPTTSKASTPSSSAISVRNVGRPIVTGASTQASKQMPTTPTPPSTSAPNQPITVATTPKINSRDGMNRTSSTKPAIEKGPPQSIGRKSLSKSTPFASSSTSIRKNLNESGESDKTKIEPITSVSKTNTSSTHTKATVVQRTTLTPTYSFKTSTNFTPSPKTSSTVKNLHISLFPDLPSSRRTPVKTSTPQFGHLDHAKDLARKTSFGSVGSNASSTYSMSSEMSGTSKSRRSMGATHQLALNMKSQKSIDELDKIYSTDRVVSALKAQKIPSAQFLRTTIQRIDTAPAPHTMNPLRKGSASELLDPNEALRKIEISNNFGMDIKTVEEDEDADAVDGNDDHQPHPTNRSSSLQDLKPLGKAPSTNSLLGVKPSPLVSSRPVSFSHRKSYMMPQTPNSLLVTDQGKEISEVDDGMDDLLSMFVHSTGIYKQHPAPALSTRSKSTNFNEFQSSPRKQVFPPPYVIKSLFPSDVGRRETASYMPSLQRSSPSAISAIYRAAVAKEAASSQTMLGRIASFKR
jgi:hypothetical protein